MVFASDSDYYDEDFMDWFIPNIIINAFIFIPSTIVSQQVLYYGWKEEETPEYQAAMQAAMVAA